MGCTSSAPNIPEITANASEITDSTNVTKDSKEDNDAINVAVENDLKDATISDVLPTCDSLNENIQLARNINSFTKLQKEEQEQGGLHFSSGNIFMGQRDLLPYVVFVIFWKTDNQLNNVEDREEIRTNEDESEQKFTTLKEVADQVILTNILEDIRAGQTSVIEQDTSTNETENVALVTEDPSPELLEEFTNLQVEDTEGHEDIEESTSPSQSDSNRSTRWEALADIAAELPPSLAVDPVTGQIYSLTK